MAINQFNPNTGKPLKKGETVTIKGTNTTVTQGKTGTGTTSSGSSGGNSHSSSSTPTPVVYSYNTGLPLAPGQAQDTINAQGQVIGAPTSFGSNINNYNPDTGQLLQPGETVTASNGQTVTQGTVFGSAGNYGSTINTDTLQNNPTVAIPDQPLATDYSSLLAGLNTTNVNDTANKGIDVSTKNNADILKQFQDLIGTPPSTADAYNKAQEQTDLLKKQQIANDLTANLNQIVTAGQTASLTLEQQAGGKGVTSAFLGRQQQEISRQTAIQALPVSAQLQAAQGNLETATENMNTLFKIYTDDATNQFNYRVQIATAFKDVATAAENKKLDLFLNQITAQHNEELAFIKQKQDIATTAATNGASASTLSAIASATDFNSALKSAGNYITNPLDTQLKNLQIQKARQDLSGGGEVPTIKQINGVDMQYDTYSENWIPVQTSGTKPVDTSALQDKIKNIDDLISSPGLRGSVGPNAIARAAFGDWNTFTGVQGDFVAGVHQLLQKETLDTLINLKKAGGTLGALSDSEGRMLREAASKINSWEKKDKNGVGTGVYKTTETSFINELETIKALAVRAVTASGGTMSTEGYLDMVDGALQVTNSPYSQAGYNTN